MIAVIATIWRKWERRPRDREVEKTDFRWFDIQASFGW